MYILTFRDRSIDPHVKMVPSWHAPHYTLRDVKIYIYVCVYVWKGGMGGKNAGVRVNFISISYIPFSLCLILISKPGMVGFN